MPTMKGKQVITNVYLDPEVYAALKKLAAATDIPMAHYLRKGVALVLKEAGVKLPKKSTK